MSRELAEALSIAAERGLLRWEEERELASAFGLSPHELQGLALEAGCRLERYARNLRGISLAEQLSLHRSRVLVAGCGGLGGYLVEELARLGVGSLVLVDPEVFDASNLNRQLLATLESLGRPKAEVAAARVALVNPAVLVEVHRARLDAGNAEGLLLGCRLAADALDSIPSRLSLEAACARLGLPLVHGAIAGNFLQASTSLPGSSTLRKLFGEDGPEKGVETELGNPAYTPALAASIQVAEIVRILCGRGPALAGRLLHLDLERMEAESFPLE